MTKKELSQLYYLNREIEMLKNQLHSLERAVQNTQICDSVQASQTDYPYTLHSVPIKGISDMGGYLKGKAEIADTKALIRLKTDQCVIEYNRLMRYIQSVDDSLVRQILTYRYINGLSWTQVAMHIGGDNTADGVRKIAMRHMSKK